MNKALLVGNGFTLNLIKEYQNEHMMKEFHRRNPDLVNRINKEFEVFRNSRLVAKDIYSVIEALFPSDDLYPSDNLYLRDDSIEVKTDLREHITDKLRDLGFELPEKIFQEYFVDYGLIYSINLHTIVGVETYLKVIHMFIQIGIFTEEEYCETENIANEVYYNYGKHGITSINNPLVDIEKTRNLLLSFTDIYTTNYDVLLDDFLNTSNKIPYHLHGGFSINHLNKNPDGRYSPKEAKLIWGINADTKYEKLRAGLDYGKIYYGAFSYGDSLLSDYFSYLQDRTYNEIHILGFSGENDDHINKRIKMNKHIKNIIIYVPPNKKNNLET